MPCSIDELRLRLEYLEQICADSNNEKDLLSQLDEIDNTFIRILGPPPALNHKTTPSNKIPIDIQKESIIARADELFEIVSSLDTKNLKIPETKHIDDTETLLKTAVSLGNDFDELNLKSTEVASKLLEQVTSENKEIS